MTAAIFNMVKITLSTKFVPECTCVAGRRKGGKSKRARERDLPRFEKERPARTLFFSSFFRPPDVKILFNELFNPSF